MVLSLLKADFNIFQRTRKLSLISLCAVSNHGSVWFSFGGLEVPPLSVWKQKQTAIEKDEKTTKLNRVERMSIRKENLTTTSEFLLK